MRVGIIGVYIDYRRRGRKQKLGILHPGIGPVIASLLPSYVEVEVINETYEDPDWNRDYDLLFISSLHSDFDRARQISHYWRRRGAKTVFGGIMASTYPELCRPHFDAIVIGDAEGSVCTVFNDFSRNVLKPVYVSPTYDPANLPTPRVDLLAGKHILPLSFEATRGCPFSCEFCALTSIGTRFHARPPELVVRDIVEGQRMLKGRVRWPKRKVVIFLDNNIGGNPRHLKSLCEAIAPLGVRWAAAITLNALVIPGVVEDMARSGCRAVYVGLESFNPAAISDMNKSHNVIDEIKNVIDRCHKNGILLESGLLINPVVDDWSYIQTIPRHLRESGLHIPVFIGFESPIPGTPFFHRLAEEPEPAFLPNALLRDFTGHTLVVKPKRESVEDAIEGYKWVLANTYTKAAVFRKLRSDVPKLLLGGGWESALGDILVHLALSDSPNPDRTYLAGSDLPPPEADNIPFQPDDFLSEEERRAIMEPWKVTGQDGRVLPVWRNSIKVFGPGGQISQAAMHSVVSR